jgi:dTDP-4-amino-4,6-dideoxygalactose transaminase
MTVPFLDLQATYRELKVDIDRAISDVLHGGVYIGGREVQRFEAEFAAFCEARFAVGVGNGLDALSLTLRALGVGPGDEVIVPSNTFIATWLAVSSTGAVPVAVEPSESTYNVAWEAVERGISERTKAIIVVHLYGQPVDLGPIVQLAKARDIHLVEDAAQCVGARYKGARIGSHSNAVCWSFYPGKNLGCFGDGGAVTTNDESIAREIRSLANYGSSEKYVHDQIGFNSRLDPLQAAVLRVKLNRLDDWNARRASVARALVNGLSESELLLPNVPTWCDPVWHLFVVRSGARDQLREHLLSDGVSTLVHYPIPPHRQGAYAKGGFREIDRGLPVSERLASSVLSLPIGPHITEWQVARVIDSVLSFKGR